jgi:Na+/melibiose symporter-like transporter
MDAKIISSVLLSILNGFGVYLFGHNIITGLNGFLMNIFIVSLALIIAINATLILRQKTKQKKLLTLGFMLLCCFLSLLLIRENLPNNGVPRQYYKSKN